MQIQTRMLPPTMRMSAFLEREAAGGGGGGGGAGGDNGDGGSDGGMADANIAATSETESMPSQANGLNKAVVWKKLAGPARFTEDRSVDRKRKLVFSHTHTRDGRSPRPQV